MCVCVSVLQAVEKINAAIKKGVAEETVNELMNPDAQLPQVYPSAADLYQRELTSLQQQSAEVKTLTSTQFQLTLSLWLFCYFFNLQFRLFFLTIVNCKVRIARSKLATEGKIQNCEFRIRKSDFISRSCKFISRNLLK